MNDDMNRLCEAALKAPLHFRIAGIIEHEDSKAIIKAVLLELRAGFDQKAKNGTLHDAQVARYAGVAIELILQE